MALGWCAALIVRESGATTGLERIFVALLPFSMYATSATIGNGQLIVHLLPALVVGLTLLGRKQRRWYEELLAVTCILGALVSPTSAAPFFWIALFVPDTPRPAVFIALGYAALTLFALSFQGAHSEAGTVLQEWYDRAIRGAGIAKQGLSTEGGDLRAVVLLAMTWVAALAPAHLLASPPPWSTLFAAGQTIVWVLVLIFLLERASHEKSVRGSV
ncbi:MAG: hypothetical protein NZ578_17505 [Candidatus Binatia bacterium]|nr:hypothetical protein [Candidatus Binatia bacterium]